MNLLEAERRTIAHMRAHLSINWEFKWDRARKRLGQTDHTLRRITLSKPWTSELPWAEVEQTVLHEIAHALVGPGMGHGPVWARQARAIGVLRPAASNKNLSVRIAKVYEAFCPNGCDLGGAGFDRLPGNPRLCSAPACRHLPQKDRILGYKRDGSIVPEYRMPAKYQQILRQVR